MICSSNDSAYGYDPRLGCPAGLCDALAAWAHDQPRDGAGGRLVVMFHELWADEWSFWHPHRWVQAWHRHQLGRLARAATHLFTTTESSAGRLRALLAGARQPAPVTVLPAGSNIPVPAAGATPAPERERGLFVLFGSQGTRVRCLRALREPLAELARRGRLRRLVLLGVGQGEALAGAEREILEAIVPPGSSSASVETPGELPATEIAAWLGRAEFGLSYQSEVNFTKSGTLMAAFAHGLDVVSPFAGRNRPAPFSAMTHPDELLAATADAAAPLPSRAGAAREWFEAHAAWPRLAAACAQAFRRGGAAAGRE